MDFVIENAIIIMFLPILSSLLNIVCLLFNVTLSHKIILIINFINDMIGLILSLIIFLYINYNNIPIIEKNNYWFGLDNVNFYYGVFIDNISSIFLVMLMVISLLVKIYSYEYMKNKDNINNYYLYINIFISAMIGLIISSNLIQMYIFWELVGVACYCLVGFYYKEEAVSESAKRVFIINRIGDVAFLSAIIILIYYSIMWLNVSNGEFLMFSNQNLIYNAVSKTAYSQIWNLIIFLFVISAIVKSAQFPFHYWLISAMKAPTPVSALIHSATMVCMGIFMLLRIFPMIPDSLLILILIIGLITAFLCAFIAINQNNIKKILAYSTSSQLGLMFVLLGVGQIKTLLIFLIIHSFTKAQLFLNAGLLENRYSIVDLNQNHIEIEKYVQLLWLIGILSLSGLFFGGFISKEMFINIIYKNGNKLLLFITLLISFLSAIYIFRLYFSIFKKSITNSYKGEYLNGDDERISRIVKSSDTKQIIEPIGDINETVSISNRSVKKENSRQPESKCNKKLDEMKYCNDDFNKNSDKSSFLILIISIISIFVILPGFLLKFCTFNLICVISIFITILGAMYSYYSKKIPKIFYKISYEELYIPKIYNYISQLFYKIINYINLTEIKIFDSFIKLQVTIVQKLSKRISLSQNANIQVYLSYLIFITGIIFILLMGSYILMEGV